MTSKTTQAIHQLFDLDPAELVFTDFSCSLHAGIIYFGRVFLCENHICFYASFFAVKQKLVVELDNVTSIELRDSNIEIEWHGKNSENQKTTLGGFENLPGTLSLLQALWKGDCLPEGMRIEEEGRSFQISLAELPQDRNKQAEIMNALLPISSRQFYDMFLADSAQLYSFLDHFRSQDAQELSLSPWQKDAVLGAETRQLAAFIKVKGVPFKSRAHLLGVHMLKWNGEDIELNILTKMQDVPFSNNFKVEKCWTVRSLGPDQCRLETKCELKWDQNCYLKSTIETRTFEDVIEDQKIWSDNAKARLAKALGSSVALVENEFEKEGHVAGAGGSKSMADLDPSRPSPVSQEKLQLFFAMVCLLCVLNLVNLGRQLL